MQFNNVIVEKEDEEEDDEYADKTIEEDEMEENLM